MNKRPFLLLMSLLVSAVLSGCKPAVPPGSAATAGKLRVALVMGSLANEFFQHMAAGAKADQSAHPADYDLIVNGIKNATDITEQANLMEQMVAQGVQIIVIAPIDSKALIPAIKTA